MLSRRVSRRTCLRGMALVSVAAAVPLIGASTTAEAKARKAAVHYRDYPSGMRMCHMCKFYLAAGGGRSGMCMGDGNDGSRSLPSGRRQNQRDGILRPICCSLKGA